MALDNAATVHLQHRRAVGERIRIKGPDDREFVHFAGEMGQEVATPQSGVAVLGEGPFAGKQLGRLDVAAPNFHFHGLAIALL